MHSLVELVEVRDHYDIDDEVDEDEQISEFDLHKLYEERDELVELRLEYDEHDLLMHLLFQQLHDDCRLVDEVFDWADEVLDDHDEMLTVIADEIEYLLQQMHEEVDEHDEMYD